MVSLMTVDAEQNNVWIIPFTLQALVEAMSSPVLSRDGGSLISARLVNVMKLKPPFTIPAFLATPSIQFEGELAQSTPSLSMVRSAVLAPFNFKMKLTENLTRGGNWLSAVPANSRGFAQMVRSATFSQARFAAKTFSVERRMTLPTVFGRSLIGSTARKLWKELVDIGPVIGVAHASYFSTYQT